MPNFPAAKLSDPVLGIDFHSVMIPPAPAPIPMVPHPYMGPILLWFTPTFPTINVFINGVPAVSVGAMGMFAHIPMGLPAPPGFPNLLAYWKRNLICIPKVLGLALLTLFANLAIAAIAALIPKPPAVESFIKDVTGIDTSSKAGVWDSVKGTFASYTKWQTWAKLLLPPLPFPGDQGSSAIGSPNVTINGGNLGFVAPLMATSCSELQFVPNAAVLGFSNVMVGVSIMSMVRALAVHAAQGAVSAGVSKAAGRLGGKEDCGCG